MGIPPPPPVDPVTGVIFVGVVTTALAITIIKRERQREAQRKRDEDRRKREKERERINQEEARRQQQQQEEARRRKQQEEEARRQQQQQQEARRQQQQRQEARRQQQQQEEARRQQQQQQEAKRRKQQEEEEARRQQQQEEEARRQQQQEEEARRQHQQQQEARRQQQQQEEARRQQQQQQQAKREQQQQEEARRQQQQQQQQEEERRERQPYRTQERGNKWWWETNNDVSGFSSFMRPRNDLWACGYCYSEPPRDDRIFSSIYSSFDTYKYCGCRSCSTKETQSINYRYFSSEEDEKRERKCYCQYCNPKYEEEWNSKNSNSFRYTSSSSGYAAKPNAAPTIFSSGNRRIIQNSSSRSTAASGSGSQPPQRNWNNKNDEHNDEDIEWLNNFLKLLKAILDRCNCPLMLRNKILGFFENFAKHQDIFKRLLGDITIQGIKEDDMLSIVIKLFMSDDFAKDVTYGNFISLIEFVAKFIKDEAKLEMIAEDKKGESQLPFEQQLSQNIEKVITRSNILESISDLFKKIRKQIVDDDDTLFLELDFSGIFTKVYHYFKHRVVRGKVMTVKEYFDWVRKLIPLVKDLRPEYVELTDPSHERREILFEMYVTAYQGYIRIVLRVYGTQVKICTVFIREKKDRNAKDGDKYVDGKKR